MVFVLHNFWFIQRKSCIMCEETVSYPILAGHYLTFIFYKNPLRHNQCDLERTTICGLYRNDWYVCMCVSGHATQSKGLKCPGEKQYTSKIWRWDMYPSKYCCQKVLLPLKRVKQIDFQTNK